LKNQGPAAGKRAAKDPIPGRSGRKRNPEGGNTMTAIIKQAAALLAIALFFAGCDVTMSDGSGDDRDNPIHLVEGSFKNGDVAKNSEQWFSFTVNSTGTYYIHVIFNTLEYLNVRVFNRNGSPISDEVNLWEHGNTWYFPCKLSETGTYNIRVRPYSYYFSDSGTYRIAYNTSSTAPK
jgi:hypothetical protein